MSLADVLKIVHAAEKLVNPHINNCQVLEEYAGSLTTIFFSWIKRIRSSRAGEPNDR